MRNVIQHAARTGVIFGLVVVFLVLIGFTTIASQLIADFLNHEIEPALGGSIPGLLIFLGLIALWAGANGAKKTEHDSWGRALAGGAVAGLSFGLVLALQSLVLGWLATVEANIRQYLPMLSPMNIRLLLLDQPALSAALLYLFSMAAAGLLGGVVGRGVGRGAWRQSLSKRIKGQREKLTQTPFFRSILTNPIMRYVNYALLLGLLLMLPLVLGQYWNFTLGTVGIYVLMGLGLNIVVGMAGLLDLGYVAFFAVGAYTIGLMTSPTLHNLNWNFWVVLPFGIIIAAFAGIVLGVPVLRLRGDYLAIVTLGFGEIIRILVKSDLLSSFAGGPQGVRSIGGPTLFGSAFSSERDFMYLIILGILLIIFVTTRLENSRVGRAWMAMREDETVAQAMGINTLKYKLLAFAIGAAFAGLGGVLFASRNQYTGPEDHSLLVSINVLSLVIVGGMGSIPGVIAGAFVLKGLPEILRQVSDYRILAFGALLVVMMIIRPEGIFPSKRRQLEFHSAELEEEHPPEPIHPKSTGLPTHASVDATNEVPISTDARKS